MTVTRRIASACFAATLMLGACGGDDEVTSDEVEDAVGDAREETEDAFASFRTGFERLVDKASTGDNEAQEELLNLCRDTLEDLRQADDSRSDEVGELCDEIRDADDQTAWDSIRQKIDDIGEN